MKMTFPKRFLRGETGSLSVEAVLILPILIWAITATLVFWDAFRTLNISQKATYTIAGMLSREEIDITADYLTSVHEIYDFLADTDGDNALRVSVVTLSDETGVEELELVWSEGVGGIDGYENLTVLEQRIPNMALGDQLIVVESIQEWAPAFAVGLASYQFREVALARPRFAATLCYETVPNCS